MSNMSQRTLFEIIEGKLSTLSCKDFDPTFPDENFIESLRNKLDTYPPYWSNKLHSALRSLPNYVSSKKILFLEILHDTQNSESERSLPRALLKIEVNNQSIKITAGLPNAATLHFEKNTHIDEIILLRKDLFKNCLIFLQKFEEILGKIIDEVYGNMK